MVLRVLGLIKLRIGNYSSAILDLNESIVLNNEFAFSYNNRGGAKYHLNGTAGRVLTGQGQVSWAATKQKYPW